jgi:flagellar motor switch protein FliN/FliY
VSAGTARQPAPDAEVYEFMKVWTSTLSEVIGQRAGAPFAAEMVFSTPPEIPPAHEQDLQVKVVAAGSLRGEMALRVPRVAVLSLGQLFLQETQDAATEIKPEHRDALEELLRQITGQVATALSSRWGAAQLRVEAAAAAPATWSPASRGWLVSAAGALCRLLLEWQLNSALVTALSPVVEPNPVNQSGKTPEVAASKMDLLMDVELDVTLRFGQRSMTLREIMELDAGSIVELDRQVQDAAELLLEGRLIAQGEVVVVDGNYGMRVLQVVSSSDKS